LLQTAVAYANALLIEQAVAEVDRVATVNRGQNSAPADIFPTKDGWIICQVIGNPMYRRWAGLMGEPEWLADPRFADDQARGDNAGLISTRMARWCAGRTSEQALAELEKANIPSGPLLAPQETIQHPHIRQAGLLADSAFPGLPRPAPIAPTPVRLSETPGQFRHRAPTLGEHTDSILTSLGYSRREIDSLRQKGVI